jgi:hypothetical protein
MRSVSVRAVALASLFFLTLPFFPFVHKADDSSNRFAWAGPYTLGTFVRKVMDGRMACLEAGIEQARRIKERDPNLPLSELVSDANLSTAQQRNLKINLRGTSQMQSFPMAIDAFKRAAARWESLIQTDVTVIIDVDFGPTLFGTQFDDDVVSSTDSQVLGGNSLYPAVRANLISETYVPGKISLYNSLPLNATPTDVGDSSGVTATSATLRALGLINQIADPDGELNSFGPPPAIGFNSKFNFDFDPNDGIDSKLDFESMALHEIGHVLGFISFVGQQEMNSSIDVEPSIWDLFRFRPDGIKSDFAAMQRILSSGGEQSFYAGGTKLGLSTGGDGKQASHWKDDNLTGQYIGVMNPTIGPGERQFITDNDISVLDTIGYRTRSVFNQTTIIPLISAKPQIGGIQTPPPSLGALSHTQYSIAVAQDATQLRIDLNGNQDVDLFVRFGQPVVIQGHNPKTDYMSTTESSSETITVTPSSSLPLRKGIYYIAVANFGPGEADFTVTATVTGGINRHVPAIFNIRANLEGDALELDCAAIDRDGDFRMADVSIVDESGRRVSSSSFAINSGTSIQIESRLMITNLSTIPTAARASIILIDSFGNRSPEAILDFSKAQSGGLTVTGASFTESKLTLIVRGVVAEAELEINGHVVAPPRKIKINTSGKKLTIKGSANQLSLHPGANRIRVKNVNGWSNIVVLNI